MSKETKEFIRKMLGKANRQISMNHKRYDHMIWKAAHDAIMDGRIA